MLGQLHQAMQSNSDQGKSIFKSLSTRIGLGGKVRTVLVFGLFCALIFHVTIQYSHFEDNIVLTVRTVSANFVYPDISFCVLRTDRPYEELQVIRDTAYLALKKDVLDLGTFLTRSLKVLGLPVDLNNITRTDLLLSAVSIFRLPVAKEIMVSTVNVLKEQIPGLHPQGAHDYVLTCDFQGQPCDFRDFRPVLTHVPGDCFTFSSEAFLKKTKTKLVQGGGLSLYLASFDNVETKRVRKVGILKSNHSKKDVIIQYLNNLSGFDFSTMFSIHPRDSFPCYKSSFYNCFSGRARNGELVTLSFKIKRFERLPQSGCSSGPRKAVSVWNFRAGSRNFSDSHELCVFLQVQRQVLARCRCVHPSFPVLPNDTDRSHPLCLRLNPRFFAGRFFRFNVKTGSLTAMDDRNHDIATVGPTNITNASACAAETAPPITVGWSQLFSSECLRPCDSTSYKLLSSGSKLHLDPVEEIWLFKQLKKHLSLAAKEGRDTSSLMKYIRRLKELKALQRPIAPLLKKINIKLLSPVVHIERETLLYPLVNFISDLGGILGLWLGITAVTAADFIGGIINFLLHWRMSKGTQNVDVLPHNVLNEKD